MFHVPVGSICTLILTVSIHYIEVITQADKVFSQSPTLTGKTKQFGLIIQFLNVALPLFIFL